MDRAVKVIVTRHRQGLDSRLQNCIWDRKIYSRSWGWTAREYTGPNPHDKHAHFSARYTAAQERDTRPWGLLTPSPVKSTVEEFVMATKDDVKQALREVIEEKRPYSPDGAGSRLAKQWNPLSLRGMLEYVLEDAMTQREATAAQVETLRQEITAAITAVSANPNTSIQLTDAQAGELAQHLLEQLPPAVATAVNDDAAARLTS